MIARHDDNTAEWLTLLGAKRPIAPSAHTLLVLGEFKDGTYPIIWRKYKEPKQYSPETGWVEGTWVETWEVFGRMVFTPLTKEDCIQILQAQRD